MTPKFAGQVLCWPLKITMQNGHCPNVCDDPAKRVPSVADGPARRGAATGGGRVDICMKNCSRVGDSGAVLARRSCILSRADVGVDEGEAAAGRWGGWGGGAVRWVGGGVARFMRWQHYPPDSPSLEALREILPGCCRICIRLLSFGWLRFTVSNVPRLRQRSTVVLVT